MTELLFILKFLLGLFLMFIIGGFIGHLFKLDKYYEDMQRHNNENSRITPVKKN